MATKLTYSEQLKHPNWQRKRLEMLNEANFECSNCGDKDSMLHVHHRQYFKGRQAWEYESTELAVLCEACHKEEHDTVDGLKKLLSEVGSADMFALCAGFHHHSDWVDRGNIHSGRETNALAYAAGLIAWMSYHLDIDQMYEAAGVIAGMTGEHSEVAMVYKHNVAHLFGREE